MIEYLQDYMTSNQSAHWKQTELSGCDSRRREIARNIVIAASMNSLTATDRMPAAMDQSATDKKEPAGKHAIALDRDAAEMIM